MQTLENTRKIVLTKTQFLKELKTCLTVIEYKYEFEPFFVCEYVSLALYKSIIHVFIK